MTVVSVLRLRTRPGGAASVTRAFAELGVFAHSRASGGFLGGRLLRPVSGDEELLVVAEWETASAYQAWLDNPVRGELAAGIAPFLAEEVSAGSLYEEVP